MPPLTITPWAFPIGVLVAALLTAGLLLWQRRRRSQRRERPPIQTRLLRPPGHTLAIWLQEREEGLFTPIAVLAVCAAGLFAGWAAVGPILVSSAFGQWRAEHGGWAALLRMPLLPATISCACGTIGFLAGVGYGLLRTSQLFKEIHWLRLGLRGEQAVAEKLLELAPEGYRAFHDFPAAKNWNIDHVLVGPPGVFAIETKTRSKRKAPPGKKDQEVVYDGKVLQFPWFTNNKAPEQAAANARWLESYLRKSTGIESLKASSLLVIPGWYVRPANDPRNHKVRAMPETLLATHLHELPRILTDQQIQQICFPGRAEVPRR
ncbi:MAG: nuclease-related domain-containing protein [Limisphaerales bacterium]